ncbi:MAG: response regulator transcription factor [Clostridia bacterium]|nr:response regulator transcription factor [Clostridia bacterium]
MDFTIMVCDDEPIYIEQMKKLLKDAIGTYPFGMNIVEKNDGFEVLKYLELEKVDVLFIDIEMFILDGMETAKQIRKRDLEMIIVFVTSHEAFALQSYEVQAFDYILKSKLDQFSKKIQRIIDALYQRYENNFRTHVFGIKTDMHRVNENDILYVEVESHRTTVHTLENIYPHSERISVVEEALDARRFFRCHNSFLVNLARADGIIQKDSISYFEMENGAHIEISRRKKKEAMDAFFQYVRR